MRFEKIFLFWTGLEKEDIFQLILVVFAKKFAKILVFSFKINNPSCHIIFQHGHKTADFHECKNCGTAFVSCEIDGDLFGVINAKVMGLKDYSIDSVLKDYSTETISMRLARRKKNWCKLY